MSHNSNFGVLIKTLNFDELLLICLSSLRRHISCVSQSSLSNKTHTSLNFLFPKCCTSFLIAFLIFLGELFEFDGLMFILILCFVRGCLTGLFL